MFPQAGPAMTFLSWVTTGRYHTRIDTHYIDSTASTYIDAPRLSARSTARRLDGDASASHRSWSL